MKLFEYACIYTPRTKKDGVTEPSKLIVDVTRVLAKAEKDALVMASRAIPEEYMDKLDQVEIVIRPF